MKLSVIIVNYNVKYFLEQCLYSVIEASKHVSTEVWVIDNNSVDGSAELVKEKYPNVNLIENTENLGFSKANNQAIKAANGEYILLLNPDTLVEEDTFKKVVAFMDSNNQAGGLGVKMIDGKGNFLPESKRGLPTPSVAFYKIFGFSTLFPKSEKFGQYHLGHLSNDKTSEVAILSGAFMLIRKNALDEVGLLDESFFMYGEDIDLSYRITQAGYKNYYFPETSIIHYKGESTKTSSVNYVFVFYRAMKIFAEKHFSKKNAQLFSNLINLAIYFRAGIALLTRFARKTILPLSDFLFHLTGLYILEIGYQHYTGIEHNNQLTNIAFTVYALIWSSAIYLLSWFDNRIYLKKLIQSIAGGTALILIGYALLPEELRFSRALILLGTIWALFSSILIRLVASFSGISEFQIGDKLSKRFALVGSEEEVNRVINMLKAIYEDPEFFAKVSPEKEAPTSNSDFHGHQGQLAEIVQIFNIDEVIFCAKNVTAQAIIQQMSKVSNSEVAYKIAPPESGFIIGSNSINSPSDLYVVKLNSVDKTMNRIKKRFLDIIISIFILIFSPLTIFISINYLSLIKNIFAVITGAKSWVGYWVGDSKNILGLPYLKPGVLHPNNAKNGGNIHYAKDYRVINDLKIIWNGFSKLDSK